MYSVKVEERISKRIYFIIKSPYRKFLSVNIAIACFVKYERSTNTSLPGSKSCYAMHP